MFQPRLLECLHVRPTDSTHIRSPGDGTKQRCERSRHPLFIRPERTDVNVQSNAGAIIPRPRTAEFAEAEADWRKAVIRFMGKTAEKATAVGFQQKSRLDTFWRFGYLEILSSQSLLQFSQLLSRLSPFLRPSQAPTCSRLVRALPAAVMPMWRLNSIEVRYAVFASILRRHVHRICGLAHAGMHERAGIQASGDFAWDGVSRRMEANAWKRASERAWRWRTDYGIHSPRDGAVVADCTDFESWDSG